MEDLVSMCERRCRKACNLRSAAEDSDEACHSGSSGARARRYRKRGSPKSAARDAGAMDTDPSPVRLWESEGHSEGYRTAYEPPSESEMSAPIARAHTAPEPALKHDAEGLERPARARTAPVPRHTGPETDAIGDTPMGDESEVPGTAGCAESGGKHAACLCEHVSVAFVCWGAGWGGGVRRTPRLCCRGGGPVGRGVAPPRSVPLPSLGRQQCGCHWRRSVHGGRGPPYHSGSCSLLSLGAICAASWRVGAGSLVLRGPCGSPRLGRGGGSRSGSSLGRGGDRPPLPRGLWAGAPAACGPVGGVGGGVAPRPPCPPSGWRPAVLHPGPPRVVGALPSGVRVRSGSRCPPAQPSPPPPPPSSLRILQGWGGQRLAIHE